MDKRLATYGDEMVCKNCGLTFPTVDFPPSGVLRKDGKQSRRLICRACLAIEQKEYKKKPGVKQRKNAVNARWMRERRALQPREKITPLRTRGVSFCLTVPKSWMKKIDELAKNAGLTRNQYIRAMLKAAFADEEK